MSGAAFHTFIPQVANHLWQSTVFVFVAALLALAFRKNRAQVRYWFWFAASLKFLVPFALLIGLGASAWTALAARKAATEIAPAAFAATVGQIAQPIPSTFAFDAPVAFTRPVTSWLLLAILCIWAVGSLAIAARRIRSWLRIRATLRASVPLDVAIPIDVRSSPLLIEPGVVGFLRPKLLLPEGILQKLSTAQLESVLAHELAHVRRHDNLTAALHMLVEAVFWFHPVVWWIGARLVEERECACDEAVISGGNSPRDYAEAILGVCKLYVESPLACVSGVTGADLKKRIHSILAGNIADELKFAKKLGLAIAGIAALGLPILVGAIGAPSINAQSADSDIPSVSFEVASVKPDTDPAHYTGNHIDVDQDEEYYTGSGLTAKYLIKYAFNLTDDQISGGPAWITSDKFVINAKSDDATAAKWENSRKLKDQLVRAEMRSLLDDRFQLKINRETKILPVFELVVAKGNPKFGPSTDKSGDHHSEAHSKGDVMLADIQNEPIRSLVEELSRQPELAGHLIVDKTGLTGSYSFELSWTMQRNNPGAADSDPASGSAAPSLWTALQEQLGLRLESGKASVDTIVIDHIEKPTPN